MKKSVPAARYGGVLCLSLLFFITSFHVSFSQTTAFPGAEGFGRYATGGRGGDVYIVTNLSDSGPGSFRDAVSKPNRIVVFAVGGVIKITSRIVVSPNITIAGQTAPGDGIVIYGNGLSFTQASNCIVRYIRIRMGVGGDSGKDALSVTDNAKNQVYDHVSVSWGRDENFSITGNADSITIQNSIIAQGLQTHSCGGLLEPSGKLSLYRNLYIDNHTRNPKVKGQNQYVNNVVYNWGGGGGYIMGGSAAESRVNIINNYYIKGPASTIQAFSRGTPTFIPYVSGNYQDTSRNGILDGVLVALPEYEDITTFSDTPFNYPMPATLLTAQQSYDHVVAEAGASYPFRDPVDNYVINELLSLGLTGTIIARETELPFGGPGDVHGAPAPADTDQDGMPDDWETANGLNPNNAADGKTITASGYTNLELYINSLPGIPPPVFVRPPSKVTAQAVSPTQVNLNWQDNTDMENQLIVERSSDGVIYAVIITLPANSTAWSDTTVIPNKTYYYRIKAANDTAASVYSTPVSVKTPNIPSAPDAPANPSPAHQALYIEPGTLLLQWTGSTNTDSFHVYFGTDANNLVKLTDTTAKAYSLANLLPNATYYWRIDASNELGLTTGDLWSFNTLQHFPEGLAGDWRMDALSGTTVADSTAYQNDGEIQDITDFEWIPGKINHALDLQQATISSHILVPHQDQLYFNKHSFSISLWIKAPPQTAQSYLLHKGTFARNTSTGATGKWFGIEVKDGRIRFAIDDDVTKSEVAVSNTPFFTNDWVHLVVMRDAAAKKLRIYRNGILEGESNDNSGGIGQTDPLVIANSSDVNVPYKGMLDELKIFNYSLSEMQVLQLFHTSPLPLQPFDPSVADHAKLEGYEQEIALGWKGGINTTHYKLYFGTGSGTLSYISDIDVSTASYNFSGAVVNTTYYWRVDAIGPEGVTVGNVWSFTPVSPKGLVGHWRLDDSSGLTATDDSYYQHHGSLTGFPDASWSTDARFGGSLLFQNPVNTGSVRVPHADHLLFDQNGFTISLWVKIAANTYNFSTGGDCYLIHKGTFEAGTGKWYGIQLRDGKLTFAIDDGSTKTDIGITVSSGTHHLFTNQWKHIVAVRDVQAKQIRLYIDGQLAGSKAYSTKTTGRLTDLTIGNSAENKPYRDLMDDVRLYNYALSAVEIAALRDTIPPVVITRNITVTLDNTGSVTIDPAAVDSGSTDNVGIVALTLDRNTFHCADIGTQEVILTATDDNGNQASATALVTVAGVVPDPAIQIVRIPGLPWPANTIYLGFGPQQVQLKAESANSGGPFTYSWSPATGLSSTTVANPVFTPTAAGQYTFTVTVTNEYGCAADTSVTINVTDARCGNNKVKLCYNGHELCVHPLAAWILVLLNHHIEPGGCGEPLLTNARTSQTTTVTGETTTAVNISAFPNPAGSQLSVAVKLADAGQYRVELYNMNGQLVQVLDQGSAGHAMQRRYNLSVSQYTSGLYLLKVITGKAVYTKRVVVQH